MLPTKVGLSTPRLRTRIESVRPRKATDPLYFTTGSHIFGLPARPDSRRATIRDYGAREGRASHDDFRSGVAHGRINAPHVVVPSSDPASSSRSSRPTGRAVLARVVIRSKTCLTTEVRNDGRDRSLCQRVCGSDTR